MGSKVSTVSGEEDEDQKKPPIQIKAPSRKEKKQKHKEDIRLKMRQNFRRLQLEEAVSEARGGIMNTDTGTGTCEDPGEGLDGEGRRVQAELYKDRGNEFIRTTHDVKSAITAYTTAISLINTNYIYFNNRAAAYLLSKQFVKAIADCDASLALKEDNIKAHTRKASALSELHQFDAAFACIADALALDPTHPETLHVQEGLLMLKVESLHTNIASLASRLQPGTDSALTTPTTTTTTATAAAAAAAAAAASTTKGVPSTTAEAIPTATTTTTTTTTDTTDCTDPSPTHDPASSAPRNTPKDRILLSPLTSSSSKTHTLQKKQSLSKINKLTYPRSTISNSNSNNSSSSSNTYCFDVKAIGLPNSLLAHQGQVFRLQCSEVEHVLEAQWTAHVPFLTLPPSLLHTTEQNSPSPSPSLLPSSSEVERCAKELREYLILRGGQGGVFRARNIRSGAIGGLCVWKYHMSGSDFDAIACWNPFQFSKDHDWALGDRIELLDFLPSLFAKINRSLSLVRSLDMDTRDTPKLHVVSSFKVIGIADTTGTTGPDIAAEQSLAAFGQCGVVGAGWGALTLEANVPQSEDRVLELVGIRTDCLKLPFSIAVRRTDTARGGGGGVGDCDKHEEEGEQEESEGQWQVCVTGALGPYVDLASVGEAPTSMTGVHVAMAAAGVTGVTGVRLVWASTDLRMLGGLGSTRGGGGLHAEVLLVSSSSSSSSNMER